MPEFVVTAAAAAAVVCVVRLRIIMCDVYARVVCQLLR